MAKFIGHRGSLGFGVENTIEAFKARIPHNVYGLECDIRISTDGKFFIMHDDDFKRLAGINDKHVWEYSSAELDKISLVQEYNGKHYYGKIAYLEDYLKICKDNNMHAIIEIKYSPNLCDDNIDKIDDLFSLIEKYNMLDQVTIISFMEKCLIKIRNRYPNVLIQLLTCGKIDRCLNTCIKYNFGVDSCVDESINSLNIKKYHDNNLVVNVWTIDDKKLSDKLALMKVDYITSNILY